jgi:putative chitinase
VNEYAASLTDQQLSLATGARIDRAAHWLASYKQVLDLYEINTRLRAACFLANVGHESGGFTWSREIWGNTKWQVRYEGHDGLGNTQPGDGKRFMGRAHMQITGRANYAAARDRLRQQFPELNVPDFEAEPVRLEEAPWAAFAGGDYIATHRLHRFADAANFDAYCDVINRGKATLEPGDTNGFDHRLRLFVAGMKYLP